MDVGKLEVCMRFHFCCLLLFIFTLSTANSGSIVKLFIHFGFGGSVWFGELKRVEVTINTKN